MTPLIYVLAFVAVVLFAQAMMSIVFASQERNRQVNRRLTMLASGMDTSAVHAALVRAPAETLLAKTPLGPFIQLLERRLRQAGVTVPVIRFVSIVVAASTALWIVSVLFVGTGIERGLISFVSSFAISATMAVIWLERRRNARRKALEDQLPVALDVINRGLRAGHPVISAIRLAANEMGDPIGSEFGLIVDESTYGLELTEALRNFAVRTQSEDAQFMAVSISIQTQTGGNLAEILTNLATVVRGRASLAKRVRSLSSEGRISARILSVLPVLLIGFLGLLHPDYYTSKFSDPIFWPIVAGVCVLYVIGRIMMTRITNVSY